MKFKIQVRQGEMNLWWEEFSYNEVTDHATAEAFAKNMIADFNETERLRYGARAHLRELLAVEFIGEGPLQHEWEKANLVTIMSRSGSYDLMRCRVCGCTARRYGVGEAPFRRMGKSAAKKYDHCPGIVFD
jgi:hypothetical protein